MQVIGFNFKVEFLEKRFTKLAIVMLGGLDSQWSISIQRGNHLLTKVQ